jgi:hypothetical protein
VSGALLNLIVKPILLQFANADSTLPQAFASSAGQARAINVYFHAVEVLCSQPK